MKLKVKLALLIMLLAGIGVGFNAAKNGKINHLSEQDQQDIQLIREGVKDFSKESTFQVFKQQQEKNQLYSPLSLYIDLAVASEDQQESTKEKILKTLNIEETQTFKIAKLMDGLEQRTGKGKFTLANSVWADKTLKMSNGYKKELKQKYKADLFSVDFKDKKTQTKIDKWIQKHTGDLIKKNEKNQGEKIKKKFINTVYLKANWQQPFDPQDTEQGDFNIGNGQKVQCDFMEQYYEKYNVRVADNGTAITLPLKNNMNITFILPNEGISPEALIEQETIWKIGDKKTDGEIEVKKANVILKLPKFELNTNIELLDAVQKIIQAKNEDDIEGLLLQGDDLEIKQRCHFVLNEEGAKLAAVTEMDSKGMASRDETPTLLLEFNRPFVFLITDEDSLPVFTGIIYNPLEN